MSSNPCGCDPEANHHCADCRIADLEARLANANRLLEESLREQRKALAHAFRLERLATDVGYFMKSRIYDEGVPDAIYRHMIVRIERELRPTPSTPVIT